MEGDYKQYRRVKMKTSVMCTALILMALIVATVQAHPGRTASDGCHYCRTNCSDWGETAGTRHCHSGSNSTSIEKLGSKKSSKETMVENHSGL